MTKRNSQNQRMQPKKFTWDGGISQRISPQKSGTKSVLPWPYFEYRRNSYGCIRHISSMNWFPPLPIPKPRSLHISITGDRVRARDARFSQRFFSNLDIFFYNYPGMAVYHRLMIFFTMNAKDLIMQHENFHIYTLKLTTIFWHCKKNPITFEQGCIWIII